MQESQIVRSRKKLSDVENIFRKQKTFENFTRGQFFEFEHVLMKIIANEKIITSKIPQIIERIDSTLKRDKRNKRNKNNKNDRNNKNNKKRNQIRKKIRIKKNKKQMLT